MKISIVVLCYNGYEYTHQLLMDIKANCPNVHEVVVVNNGSEDVNVRLGLDLWVGMKTLPLSVSHLAVNRGFPGGMNYGIKKATGDIVVVLSNDVRIVSNKFLGEIERCFKENDEILLGQSLYTHDTGWNNFNGIIIPYVEGYCLAGTKKFWNDVGGFDERYGVSDFEDVDLSYTAEGIGYSLVQLKGRFVLHLGGKTLGYGEHRSSRTVRNRKIFAEKWELEE